jgi:molecular chaperone DnaJ
MATNHYHTLKVHPEATQAEIKQAYRRLVKQFHPDSNPAQQGHDQIATINAAYEVLGDPQQRRFYDRELGSTARFEAAGSANGSAGTREQRRAAAQEQYRQRRTGSDSDEQLQQWLQRIYQPVNRMLGEILSPLQEQLDELSYDPFDDELLEDFQAYLDDCRDTLKKAQRTFQSMPNPSTVAGVAASLYYCLNQVGDGIDELERFISSYNEQYLHTGQELFRIAWGLRRESQAAVREIKMN